MLFNLYESAKVIRLLLTEHFKLYNPTRMSFAHRWHHDKTKWQTCTLFRKKNLFDCYDWKNLTSITFVYAQLFMTVQVRKVASISVLCSLLYFFAGREAVLLKRRFILLTCDKKKQEKKSRCFFRKFLWPIHLVSSLVFIVPYPDQLDTVIASGHRRLRQPCTCIWNIRCNAWCWW